MEGDRERCVAAGMDDYLAKPFRREQMLAMLRRHLRDDEAASAPPRADPVADAGEIFDPAPLESLRQIERGGAAGLVVKVVETWIESSRQLIAQLQESLAAGDVRTLHRAAHTLKSSSANVGAMRLSLLAKTLEADADAGRTVRRRGADRTDGLGPRRCRGHPGTRSPGEDSCTRTDAAASLPLTLVVDDDPMMRLIATQTLSQHGFRVLEAADGEQALAMFAREQPDLVLLDVVMPGIDGYETCRRLRELKSGQHVPVLMLTGLDDLDSINRAYEAGATDFVSKPINWAVLGHRVRYMLRAAETFKDLAESQALLSSAQRIARLGSWSWDLAGQPRAVVGADLRHPGL